MNSKIKVTYIPEKHLEKFWEVKYFSARKGDCKAVRLFKTLNDYILTLYVGTSNIKRYPGIHFLLRMKQLKNSIGICDCDLCKRNAIK